MKPTTPEFAADLAENLTYLCRVWSITRKDGVVFYLTDHDRDVPFEGQLYKSDKSFTASAIETRINSAASNMDLTVLLEESALTFDDLSRGLYDNAFVSIDQTSWKDPTRGYLPLFRGLISTKTFPNKMVAVLSVLGNVGLVSRNFTEQYSATCRAIFGDQRCKVDLDLYSLPFTVQSSPHGQAFLSADLTAEPTGRYTLGTVEWHTGDNTGVRTEVATNNAGNVYLFLRAPFPIKPGDTGTITRGCPKTLAACEGYNNRPNYRGEPFVPGKDGLSK